MNKMEEDICLWKIIEPYLKESLTIEDKMILSYVLDTYCLNVERRGKSYSYIIEAFIKESRK